MTEEKDFMLRRVIMFRCVLVHGLKEKEKSKLSSSLGSRMLLCERQYTENSCSHAEFHLMSEYTQGDVRLNY